MPIGCAARIGIPNSALDRDETHPGFLTSGKLEVIAEQERQKELASITGGKPDVGWGTQIRSYVFHPYNMVKDHRTNKETSNIQAVMDGDINNFINAFLSDPDLTES